MQFFKIEQDRVEPGSKFGPLQGTVYGRFGALFSYFGWHLLVRREALERPLPHGLWASGGGQPTGNRPTHATAAPVTSGL